MNTGEPHVDYTAQTMWKEMSAQTKRAREWMNNYPTVSCLCSTYNRPQLLKEAVRCFLEQTYAAKELIILNDHPGQHLWVDTWTFRQGVRVVNWPTRMGSLGEKRQWLKQAAGGDLLCIWDDDDLHLPHKIETAVQFFQTNPEYDVYSPVHAVVLVDNKDPHIQGNYFEAGATIKAKYARTHNYPWVNIQMDQAFMRGARTARPEETGRWTYVYRWGMHVHHLSGYPAGDVPQNWLDAVDETPLPDEPQRIQIIPAYDHDYWTMLKEANLGYQTPMGSK